MPLYKPGTRVRLRKAGNWETISHVSVRRYSLTIYLVGRAEPANPQDLELEPTVFTTLRVPEGH